MKRIAAMLLVLACALSWAAVAGRAQRSSELRSVRGTVIDKSDAPTASAVVYLRNTRTLTVKTYISEDRGEYHFQVHVDANKLEIRQAIQTLFGVRVTGVWTSNHRGKDKRMGKSVGRKPHWKRAIVKLAEGDKIEIFEG